MWCRHNFFTPIYMGAVFADSANPKIGSAVFPNMATLLSCQPPPPPGCVTTMEHECRFIFQLAEGEGEGGPTGMTFQTTSGRRSMAAPTGLHQVCFPDVEITCERDGTFISDATLRESLFLPVSNENPWKRVWNTWRDEGSLSALEEMANLGNEEEGSSIKALPARGAASILSCIEKLRSVRGHLFPRSQMSTTELTSAFSLHSDWKDASIRAVALHPRLPFVAVGRKDDLLEIKALKESAHSIFLKDKKQSGIIAMEWAPHCNNLLAVGTSAGVLLWNIDPTAPSSRFLTSWVRVETSPGHAPVTSLSWSPHGNFLVSASPADNSLIVWDVPMGVATRVKRAKGGGLSQVLWSPDSQKVFASSVESVFRVWETQNWTCEKWSNFHGRCKAACWSPKGDVLIFALEDDPSLYYLSFRGYELAAGSTSAIKCADLSPCTVTMENGQQVVVGGNVQNLAWDTNGERLAVVFTPESPGAELVAILRTRTSHMLEVIHGGFVRGREGECPSLVAFKADYREGALLATVWSGSRISFTPLNFQPSSILSPSPYPEQLASDSLQQPQFLPVDTGFGRGDSTPLGRASLRAVGKHTPLYSTGNRDHGQETY